MACNDDKKEYIKHQMLSRVKINLTDIEQIYSLRSFAMRQTFVMMNIKDSTGEKCK